MQKQIRETLEKLQGKGAKSKGAKYRKDKRVLHKKKSDDEQAQTVAQKYNDIAEATKEKDTRYYAVSLSLVPAKKDNNDDIPF